MTKKPESETDLRKTLEQSLDQAEWSWLAKHLERDAVILVAPALDLLEVGMHLAQDHTAVVQEWIAKGQLGKPSGVQLEAWKSEPAKLFKTVVVQPYVLIQEILH